MKWGKSRLEYKIYKEHKDHRWTMAEIERLAQIDGRTNGRRDGRMDIWVDWWMCLRCRHHVAFQSQGSGHCMDEARVHGSVLAWNLMSRGSMTWNGGADHFMIFHGMFFWCHSPWWFSIIIDCICNETKRIIVDSECCNIEGLLPNSVILVRSIN